MVNTDGIGLQYCSAAFVLCSPFTSGLKPPCIKTIQFQLRVLAGKLQNIYPIPNGLQQTRVAPFFLSRFIPLLTGNREQSQNSKRVCAVVDGRTKVKKYLAWQNYLRLEWSPLGVCCLYPVRTGLSDYQNRVTSWRSKSTVLYSEYRTAAIRPESVNLVQANGFRCRSWLDKAGKRGRTRYGGTSVEDA